MNERKVKTFQPSSQRLSAWTVEGQPQRAPVEDAKKIVLLTGQHLYQNPRAFKSAQTLASNGYCVEVLGAWFDRQIKARDCALISTARFKFTPVVDWTSNRSAMLIAKLRRRVGTSVHAWTGAANRLQLGYSYPELRAAAFRRSANIFVSHSEQGMAVAVDLLRSGRRVGIDMEDWFSEDLLASARKNYPISLLRNLECTLLSRASYAACTSSAMSDALAQDYGCCPPSVVYNVFPLADRAMMDGLTRDRLDASLPSIHWFSQTVGPGRGLDDLAAALFHVPQQAEIHLRGNLLPGYASAFLSRVPERWRKNIHFQPVVAPDELISRIAEHDIGFAGEETFCRNRVLTVTNKVFQYLLGGLAVVASDTEGQSEIARQAPRAISLYRPGDAVALAERLNALLSSKDKLQISKMEALAAAEQLYCWEKQQTVLLDRMAAALN